MRFSIGRAFQQRTLPKRSAPTCRICNEPVDLTTSKTDEDGQAIHEECYLQRLHINTEPKSAA